MAAVADRSTTTEAEGEFDRMVDGAVGKAERTEPPPSSGPDDAEPDLPAPLDWRALFAEDRTEDDWLLDRVLARGRGHALWAPRKLGKSLFALWCAVELATGRDDVDVIYLDLEMTRADVRERAEDMGLDGVDLARLHYYYLLPTLPALDTEAGMRALVALVDRHERPGCDVAVIIDTTARVVEGEENSADTFRAFCYGRSPDIGQLHRLAGDVRVTVLSMGESLRAVL